MILAFIGIFIAFLGLLAFFSEDFRALMLELIRVFFVLTGALIGIILVFAPYIFFLVAAAVLIKMFIFV